MDSDTPNLNLQEIRDHLHGAAANAKMVSRFAVEAAHLTDPHYLQKRLTLTELRDKVESAKKRADQASTDLRVALELLAEGDED